MKKFILNNYQGLWRLGALIIIFCIFFFTFNQKSNPADIKYVKIAGQGIKAELALTKEVQAQGLSGRAELKKEEGMLFVFELPGKYYFWMKGMNFPIDMIWINEDMKVVFIKKNAHPEAPPQTYGPTTDAQFVLEVSSGFADKNNLKEGDSVLFTY